MQRLTLLLSSIEEWNSKQWSSKQWSSREWSSKEWRSNTLTPLSSLLLVLLRNTRHLPQINQFLSDMHAQPLYTSACHDAYAGMHHTTIHVVDSLDGEEPLLDTQFLARKQTITKMAKIRSAIFISFESHTESLPADEQMELLSLSTCKERHVCWQAPPDYAAVAARYEALHRGQIMEVLHLMKKTLKERRQNEKRMAEWMKIIKDSQSDQTVLTAHTLMVGSRAKESLVSSLEGSYSPQNGSTRSLQWELMELLDVLWKSHGENLLQDADGVSLREVQEIMRVCESGDVGGFLEANCFRRIFLPALLRFKREIMTILEEATERVAERVASVLERHFQRLSIAKAFSIILTADVSQFLSQFLAETLKNVDSQIHYLYAPSQDFWSFRQVQSNLYRADQQINIEVKYIGKIYVRRIYESLRQNIPRYVGHGLLLRLSSHLQHHFLDHLLHVLRNQHLELIISPEQIKAHLEDEEQTLKLEKIVNYFALRVPSFSLIRNFYEKKEREWKRSYGPHTVQIEQQVNQPQEDQPGFFAKLKGFFKRKRRAGSVEAKPKEVQPPREPDQKGIAQKDWLLAIHRGTALPQALLDNSANEGFPVDLRAAIWTHLATKDLPKDPVKEKLKSKLTNEEKDKVGLNTAPKEKKIRVDELLSGRIDPQISRQIKKDIPRTHPSQLFTEGQPLAASLGRVLEAYSVLDSEIGYTQGMNIVCGAVLRVLWDHFSKTETLGGTQKSMHKFASQQSKRKTVAHLEEKAFAIFRYLMRQQNLRKIMFVQREYIADLCLRLGDRVSELNPSVWRKVQASGFSWEMLFGGQLISALTGGQLPWELQQRVLDVVIVRGFSVLHGIIAQFVAHSSSRINKLENSLIFGYVKNAMYSDTFSKIGSKGLTRLLARS